MDKTGRRCENARMESFFLTAKKGKPYRTDTIRLTRVEVETIIFRYIHHYNRRRIYPINQGLPPIRKREQYYSALLAA